ncbi:hypothetical protein ACFV6E_19515 [Streptomyces sp. NPDC059785]|uniref:hypothetical protein n=1 Tax=Streptomyces sp. NPDC059785 TaxID=3346945 RepID=UPI003650EB34
MNALATRPRRLALACALVASVTLTTAGASAATATGAAPRTHAASGTYTASGTSDDRTAGKLGKHEKPGKPPAAIAYKPTAHAPGDVNAANRRFAACMREQGQKYFPDFHASKDENGAIRLEVKVIGGKGFDPTADAYQDALDACAPIMEKAGITFPDGPDGLPPLPEKPGKPGKSGTSGTSGKGEWHSKQRLDESGEPGEPDAPTLTTTAENT